ncbi:TIGR03915 family putative DNA repair protein [Faecalimonas umbilicata]|uniref:TIGR03915 family putative DNA repair protein n=1 Tax=Faecalimonas umbilicata TaxID=1912855 RepID=UPI0022E54D36|nr:TIGR03915 family putative DNA repair protein [Faecalimonas umbilicata]
MRIIYVCEDSLTGIFSGIYEVWKRKMTAEEADLEVGDSFERRLFCEYIFCKAEERKALAVIRMIQKNLGADVYEKISYALLSADRRKAEMVFRAMLEAKKLSRKDRLMEHLGNEAVRAVFGMYRQVANEAHHYKGFVRFRELKNKTLFAKIEPKHAVLPCIAEHFADRFPQENWVIYDKTHEVFLIHEKGKRYYFLQQYMCMKGDSGSAQNIAGGFSEEEMDYEALWKEFVQSISVAERENRALQNQNLPLRFRTNLVEFSKEERSDSPNFGEFSS